VIDDDNCSSGHPLSRILVGIGEHGRMAPARHDLFVVVRSRLTSGRRRCSFA
jgi:hypothetical protein